MASDEIAAMIEARLLEIRQGLAETARLLVQLRSNGPCTTENRSGRE